MKHFAKTHLKFWYVHLITVPLSYYTFIFCIMMVYVLGHYENTIPVEFSLLAILLLFTFISTLPFIIPNYFVVRRSHNNKFEWSDLLRVLKYQFFTFVVFIPIAFGISQLIL